MQEIAIKTHLIITDIHDEYSIKWHGSLKNTNPLLENGLPVFVLISSTIRVELNTIDINKIEECAKRITSPKGRGAISTDKTFIYIKEVSGNQAFIGTVIHNRVKQFAPMYDKVGYER